MNYVHEHIKSVDHSEFSVTANFLEITSFWENLCKCSFSTQGRNDPHYQQLNVSDSACDSTQTVRLLCVYSL